MDGHIMRHGIISSCQSAATAEIRLLTDDQYRGHTFLSHAINCGRKAKIWAAISPLFLRRTAAEDKTFPSLDEHEITDIFSSPCFIDIRWVAPQVVGGFAADRRTNIISVLHFTIITAVT